MQVHSKKHTEQLDAYSLSEQHHRWRLQYDAVNGGTAVREERQLGFSGPSTLGRVGILRLKRSKTRASKLLRSLTRFPKPPALCFVSDAHVKYIRQKQLRYRHRSPHPSGVRLRIKGLNRFGMIIVRCPYLPDKLCNSNLSRLESGSAQAIFNNSPIQQ